MKLFSQFPLPKKLLQRQPAGLDKQEISEALNYIREYWDKLEHFNTNDDGTLIGLPYPYLAPTVGSDEFKFNEQYYWDSYFTALGLSEPKYQKLVEGMLENLLYLFKRFGIVPNASRMYFTGRSQPPILTSFIFLIYKRYNKSPAWLQERIAIAQTEYNDVWMSKEHPRWHNVHHNLSRYYDINVLHDLAEAESGWDLTPRFERKCLDFLPVDLNSLLYKYESDFAKAAEIAGDQKQKDLWQAIAKKRADEMHDLMWGNIRGFYFDYNYNREVLGNIWSLAGFYPMWVGMVSKDHADRMVDNLDRFEKPGGLSTTAQSFIDTSMFGSLHAQWAFPNGWAPLQYITIEGLKRYGYYEHAERLERKWLNTNLEWFKNHQVFLEKYNVVQPRKLPLEGVYPLQTGFGWTNAIFECFARDLGLTN